MEGGDHAIARNYIVGKTIGRGAFGKVKDAQHIPTGHKVAIKILHHDKIEGSDVEDNVKREIKICRLLVHPHVIRVYEVIETSLDTYVVMEYMSGGELHDYVSLKKTLPEDEARHLFQQIISGIEYCHVNMIAHRDIKLENLLLDSNGNVKIADFGFSNIIRDGQFLKTSCGSPNYAAPEVVSGKHYTGPEVDVWSCGIVLYVLLCGAYPFDDKNIPNVLKKIKIGKFFLPKNLSSGARDLISKMLVVDPIKRVTTSEIREHTWFKNNIPRSLAMITPAPDHAIDHLRKLDVYILKQVITMGYDATHLIDSLKNRLQNDVTVAYYLLFDNRVSTAGDPNAGFHEPMEHDDYSDKHGFLHEKRWAISFETQDQPLEIMTNIKETLQGLNVKWKMIGQNKMKCLLIPAINPTDEKVAELKFELQLYKTMDMKYLLDLQILSGCVDQFTRFCFIFRLRFDIY